MKFNTGPFVFILLFLFISSCKELSQSINVAFKESDKKSEVPSPTPDDNAEDEDDDDISPPPFTCPDGYIKVPAEPILGTEEFCVMQYEAKAWNDSNADGIIDAGEIVANGCSNAGCTVNNWGLTNLPVSTSEGLPWRKISQANAQKRCQALNDVDEKKFDLISRLEWIAISYNIERQAANWTNNDPVNGCLSRGNNAVDNVCGYIGLGRPEGGADVRDPRASMVLSTGEYIWDFAGNVWEWNNWELDFDNIHTAPGCSSNGPVWGHFDVASCAIIDPLLIMPLNELNLSPYNGSRGLGKLYPSGHGSPLAGGAYDRNNDINGIYAINLDGALGATYATSGFRCVYRKE